MGAASEQQSEEDVEMEVLDNSEGKSADEDEEAEKESVATSTDPGGGKKPATPTAPSPAPSATGIDAHPYARGSVIEVLHGKPAEQKETFWWSDDSDEEETPQDDDGEKGRSSESSEEEKKGGDENDLSVRLCDIIDRATTEDGSWRYYVHYRDFNRRMDEWIGMNRIVSPPSVGNAKARALKKEEDKLKRKLAKLEEESKMIVEKGPRGRRTSTTDLPALAAGTASGDDTTPRMTRRQRRKSDIDLPSMESGTGESSEGEPAALTSAASESADNEVVKEVVTIASTTPAETTKVGDHVVATIPAQELDEHEGLDEASLREHEEVTKVKNVAFLELGQYQMECWYFSPLPKELLSERGFIEILYVDEFSLNMFARKSELLRYQARELSKNQRHPPGNEIYRNGNLSSKYDIIFNSEYTQSNAFRPSEVFEIDGLEEKIYCQNLCYIAKLFLDHKTLYFDVDPFLFYILCEGMI
jgi:hypothetical protein